MSINPIVTDEIWRGRFTSVPIWEPGVIRHALVISPHPDDETLGTGGLIAQLRDLGARVTVVAVTDGENAYTDVPDQARVRRIEQTEALARLNVPAHELVRLGLPDSGVTACEDELTGRLRELAEPGMHLISPWEGDFHPDHEACGRAAQTVARELGLPLTSYFFWTWHRGTLETVQALTLRRVPLSGPQYLAKQDALACHHSQLVHHDGEPILPPHLLGPAAWPFEVFYPR